MAKKTQSSFTPVSASEEVEILRGKKGTSPQVLTPPVDAAAIERTSPDDMPATASGIPAGVATPVAPPAGPGAEHPVHEPVLENDEVAETRHHLRPTIGPDGKPLPSADALEAAIDKGQKEAARKKAEAEVAATKAAADKEAADKATADKAEADKKAKEAGTPPAGETPVTPPVGEGAPAVAVTPEEKEVSDEEIIQFLSTKSKNKFIRYATENKTLKAKNEQLEKENKGLADKALAPEGDPKAKEELDGLRDKVMRYDRLYEVENDPVIQTKFEEPVIKAEADIIDLLRGFNLSDISLKTVKDAGGFAAFSSSSVKIPVMIDGAPQEMTGAELAKNWLDSMNVNDRALLQGRLADQQRTRAEKKTFIATEKTNAKEYFAKRVKEAKEQTELVAATNKKIVDDYATWVTKMYQEDWLKDKPVPDKATEEEKKAVAEHNKYTEQMRALFVSVGNIKNVNDFAALVLDAAQFHRVRRDAAEKDREITRLKSELETVQAGLSTTPKAGSIRTSAKPPKEPEKKKVDPRMVDSAAALDAAIEEGERKRTAEADE